MSLLDENRAKAYRLGNALDFTQHDALAIALDAAAYEHDPPLRSLEQYGCRPRVPCDFTARRIQYFRLTLAWRHFAFPPAAEPAFRLGPPRKLITAIARVLRLGGVVTK